MKKPPELPDLLKPIDKNRARWKTWVFCGAGVLLIALGVSASLVPFFPGFPFVLVGFAMISTCSATARRWINAGERKLPYKLRVKMRLLLQKIPIRTIRAMFQELPHSTVQTKN